MAASLAPHRVHAARADDLVALVRPRDPDALRRALARVEAAFAADFPENIFLDLDFLAASLADEPVPALEVRVRLIEALSHAYGSSPISFRYAHDFLYGFDWCRWVARDAAARASVGPFDVEFLRYLLGRASELRSLIAANDAKYGHIAEGTFRNPFSFSRAPDDEARLHRLLAERGLVPVEAWSTTGRSRWDAPYAKERSAVARELSIASDEDTARTP